METIMSLFAFSFNYHSKLHRKKIKHVYEGENTQVPKRAGKARKTRKEEEKKRFSEKGGVVEERQGYKKTPYVSDLYTT